MSEDTPTIESQLAFTERVLTSVQEKLRARDAEIERLRARVAELEARVEDDDNERHEIVAGLVEQRDECRRLLNEAAEAWDNAAQSETVNRYPTISRQWYDEAEKAGGGT